MDFLVIGNPFLKLKILFRVIARAPSLDQLCTSWQWGWRIKPWISKIGVVSKMRALNIYTSFQHVIFKKGFIWNSALWFLQFA